MARDGIEFSRFVAVWRGIAVLLVLYFHYSSQVAFDGTVAPATFPMHLGRLGVLIFFVISGYLIAKSLDACRTLGEFYAKRLSRIWPLFVLASVVVFLFATFVAAPPGYYGEPLTVADLIGTILFLNNLGFAYVDGAYWSILVELKFYLIVGVFAAVFRADYVRWFCYAAIGLAALDLTIVAFGQSGTPTYDGNDGPLRLVSAGLHVVTVAQYLPFFAIGILLHAKTHRGLLSAAIVIAAASSMISVANDAINPNAEIRFFILLAVILATDHLLLRDRIFLWLGKYSYALYLFHQVIGMTIVSLVAPRLGTDLAIAIALALVAVVAVVGSWAVEWRYRRNVAGLLLAALSLLGVNRVQLHGEDKAGQSDAARFGSSGQAT